jgi:hypothetical protein
LNGPSTLVSPANTLVPGQQSQRTKSGDGVGGSVLLPFTKYVDFQASAMYGSGIGRYGAAQLSDVVVAPDGSLSPIKAVHALTGVVVHPWALMPEWKRRSPIIGASSPRAP